jgi:hypothetical protein
MLRELRDDPTGHRKPVDATVQGEIRPGVRVPLRGDGREVRRIGEDAVEPPEAGREVGSNGRHASPVVPRPRGERPERVRVPVGRDDVPAGAGRGETKLAVPASDLEQPSGSRFLGERAEKFRVLADRIHRGRTVRNRVVVGS